MHCCSLAREPHAPRPHPLAGDSYPIPFALGPRASLLPDTGPAGSVGCGLLMPNVDVPFRYLTGTNHDQGDGPALTDRARARGRASLERGYGKPLAWSHVGTGKSLVAAPL